MSPHEILGIAPDAGPNEVRRAWRRQAFASHPDHGGDETTFLVVHQAFVRVSTAMADAAGPAPVLVRRLGPGSLALRWCRRHRDRLVRPRVV